MSRLIFTTSFSSSEFAGSDDKQAARGHPANRSLAEQPPVLRGSDLINCACAPPSSVTAAFLRIICPFDCRLLLRASRNPHFSDLFNSFMSSRFYEPHLLISFLSPRHFSDSFLSSFPSDALQGIARRKVVSIPSHRSTSTPIKQSKNALK